MLKKNNHNSGEDTTGKKVLKDKKGVRLSYLNRIPILKQFSSLRMKLILSFLVPIAFIILLGVASYQMAASGLSSKYRETAIQVVDKTAEYMSFGLETVDNTSLEYLNDKNVAKYITYLDASSELIQIRSTIQNDFLVKSMVDSFIQNIYLISKDTKAISSNTSIKVTNETYKEIMETEAGKLISNANSRQVWFGSAAFIDEKIGTRNSDYALRLIRRFPSQQALLIVDVKYSTIKKIIEETNLDESGILAFVTEDGKEIVKGDKTELVFSDQVFYKNALDQEDHQGSEYVNVNGKSYLFMYSKVGDTGAMICSLIPKSTITGQAANIKNVTLLIVIIACIIAVFTGVFISTGIDKTIKGIISGLRKAAQGDLTVEFHTNRRDEFKTLIDEIQSTFSNMKDLVRQVNLLSGAVAESSSEVNHTSTLFLKSAEDISRAINEIEQGVTQQAKDAEECLMQMDNLSQKIVAVSDNTREISQIADITKQTIMEGTYSTQELSQQTKSTIEITTDIIKDIETLAEKSVAVTQIINVINEIASQTNLLSLNASIEAARAGEFGRGFAVVASEIRGLAEKSQQSVHEIQKIISSIWDDTKTAVETAKKVEAALGLQENAVNHTTASYDKINGSVEKLMMYLNYISESVENMEVSRVSTLGSIENISAVLEEMAASSNSVGQITTNQLNSVEALNKSAGTLKENAEELSQAIQKFTV